MATTLDKSPLSWQRWLPWLLVAALAYFPIFHQLGTEAVKNFDESWFALRAYHLATTGEYLNNFKELPGGASATNLKNPLFTGVQALSFRLLGYNELALRLPVGMMVAGLLILMGWIAHRIAGRSYAVAVILVFLACEGFFHVHAARSGDHDAPLAAWLFLATIALYRWSEAEEGARQWLWVWALATLAAVLTKGVAGLFFLPGFAGYLLYRRQWSRLLKDPQAWYALGVGLLVIAGYYAYREWDYPGFLEQLWKGELGGHYFETRDGHRWPFWWYLERLITIRATPWMAWLLLPWVVMWTRRFQPLRPWMVLMSLVFLSQLLVISFSSTKLEWYDVPLYPPLAMLVGAGIWSIWESLRSWLPVNRTGLYLLLVGSLLAAIWLAPFSRVLEKNLTPSYLDYPGERYGPFMKQLSQQFPERKAYTLLYTQFSNHCLFYQLVYNQQRGYEIQRATAAEDLRSGEYVMLCEPEMWQWVQAHFRFNALSAKGECQFVQLGERISSSDG